jgi:DNA-binding transcriptional MerR regulator
MPQVISFPNDFNNNLRICQDAISKLAIALSDIRALIDLCSDGPTKTYLSKQQRLLKEQLEDAKVEVKQLKTCAHLDRTIRGRARVALNFQSQSLGSEQ